MARQKLIETFQGDWQEKALVKKLPLNESTRIIEKNGKKYEVLGAYKVPVWRLDKRNLNERVYSTKLAEKVVKEGKITYACDGHIESPKYEDVKAVGKNPSIEKGILWSECYFVDEDFYKKAERLIEAGAGLGLSSSSWGDQDDEGNIKLEGFEVERYFDFVLDPSYEVYMTNETRLSEEDNFEKKDTNIILENTEEKIPVMEKKIMADKKTMTLEEKNLKLGVQGLLEKANNSDHPKDKVSIYKDAIHYLEGIESEFALSMVEEINSKISEIETELLENYDKVKEVLPKVIESEQKVLESDKKISETAQQLEEVQSVLENTQEKLDIALSMIDDFKARELKLKEMYDFALAERNGMVTAEEYNELTKYIESIEARNETLKKENKKLLMFVESTKEKRVKGKIERVKESAEEIYGYDKDDLYQTDIHEEIEDEFYEDETYAADDDYFEYDSIVTDEFRDIEGVQEYYDDLYLENKNVSKIKKEIMRCKTVLEAQKTYMNLVDLIEGGNKRVARNYEVKSNKQLEPSLNRMKRNGWV